MSPSIRGGNPYPISSLTYLLFNITLVTIKDKLTARITSPLSKLSYLELYQTLVPIRLKNNMIIIAQPTQESTRG